MKTGYLLIVILLFSQSVFGQSGNNIDTISFCFFSMNNTAEMPTLEKFLLSRSAQGHFKVTEYQKKGTNPEENLKALIASGEKCDALILSGHHSGDFWGGAASDKLHLSFLEEESCSQPEWFSKLRLVYLDGCRTAGASHTVDSDAEVHRVMRAIHAGVDQGDEDAVNLALGFDSVYDEFDPISTRHAAIFPYAKIFGFSGTAPSIGASELSIPYFIENLNKLAEAKYHRQVTLHELLNSAINAHSQEAIKIVGEAWENTGKRGQNLGMRVSDPKGYDDYAWTRGIFLESESHLKEIHKAYLRDRCAFVGEKWTAARAQALQSILNSRDAIIFNFSSIQAALEKPDQREKVIEVLERSSNFLSFLQEKLNSNHISLLGRLKLYGVFHQLDKSGIQDKYFASLARDSFNFISKHSDSDEIRDLQAAVSGELPFRFEDTRGWLPPQERRDMTEFVFKAIAGGLGGRYLGGEFGASLDIQHLASLYGQGLTRPQSPKEKDHLLNNLGFFTNAGDFPFDGTAISEYFKAGYTEGNSFIWSGEDFVSYALSTPKRTRLLVQNAMLKKEWATEIYQALFYIPQNDVQKAVMKAVSSPESLHVLLDGAHQYIKKFGELPSSYWSDANLFSSVKDQDLPYLAGLLDTEVGGYVAQLGLAGLRERIMPALMQEYTHGSSLAKVNILWILERMENLSIKYLDFVATALQSPDKDVALHARFVLWKFEKNYLGNRTRILSVINDNLKKPNPCELVSWLERFQGDSLRDVVNFYDRNICKLQALSVIGQVEKKPLWLTDKFAPLAADEKEYRAIAYYVFERGDYSPDHLISYWALSDDTLYRQYLIEGLVRTRKDKTPQEVAKVHKALEAISSDGLEEGLLALLYLDRLSYESDEHRQFTLLIKIMTESMYYSYMKDGMEVVLAHTLTSGQRDELISTYVDFCRGSYKADRTYSLSFVSEVNSLLSKYMGGKTSVKAAIRKRFTPKDSKDFRKRMVED